MLVCGLSGLVTDDVERAMNDIDTTTCASAGSEHLTSLHDSALSASFISHTALFRIASPSPLNPY